MKSAQCGMTELLVNAVLRTIDCAPVPTLLVEPSLEMASALMRTRIRPALELMPALAAKIRGRTQMHLDVDGASIEVVGGRSASALSSRAIGQLLGDELDRLEHDLDGEGDPWQLARRERRRSPTIAGGSRIESLYLASDRRRLHVACPACGERSVPTIAHLVERDSVRAGSAPRVATRWTKPAGWRWWQQGSGARLVSPVRGYQIWSFYRPWVTMAEILASGRPRPSPPS